MGSSVGVVREKAQEFIQQILEEEARPREVRAQEGGRGLPQRIRQAEAAGVELGTNALGSRHRGESRVLPLSHGGRRSWALCFRSCI